MTSPWRTSSPTALSQRLAVPSSIPIPDFGKFTLTAISVFRSQQRFHGRHDLLLSGIEKLLQRRAEGNVNIWRAQTNDRFCQAVERLFAGCRGNLGAHVCNTVAVLDHDQAPGLRDRSENRVHIERFQCPRVNDLRRYPLCRQDLGRLEGGTHRARYSHQGYVLAHYLDVRLADGNEKVGISGNLALHGPQACVLEDDHWVIVAYRGLQQALDVRGGARADQFQSRRVQKQRVRPVRVLRGECAAVIHAAGEDDRHADLPPGHVSQLGRLVDNLIRGQIHEAGDAEIDYRTQPPNRRPNPDACEGPLGNRRAPDARFVESIDDAAAAIDGDVLPHEDHALVALHLLDLRLNDRLEICDLHLTSAVCVVLAVRKSRSGLINGAYLRFRGTCKKAASSGSAPQYAISPPQTSIQRQEYSRLGCTG